MAGSARFRKSRSGKGIASRFLMDVSGSTCIAKLTCIAILRFDATARLIGLPKFRAHRHEGGYIIKKSVLTFLATTALIASAAAWAQEAADGESGGLDEIIVTAQKRAEGLSDVPISITAVGGDAIEAKGTANLEQLSSSVPNLRITQTGIANRISIRGISSGDNKGFEQSAAMFVDGVYFGRDQLVRLPIVDVERVEVLRGPQPTLFGKNAIAGAISIINRTPSDAFEGKVNASYEFEHKETQLTGVLNLPISAMADARVVGYYRKQGG